MASNRRHNCPECDSSRTRTWWPSDDVVVLMCADCKTTTTSLYGDIEVVSDD